MYSNLLDGKPLLGLLIGVVITTTSRKSDPGSILKDGHSGNRLHWLPDTVEQMEPTIWLNTGQMVRKQYSPMEQMMRMLIRLPYPAAMFI
jgi:hypothetical protein